MSLKSYESIPVECFMRGLLCCQTFPFASHTKLAYACLAKEIHVECRTRLKIIRRDPAAKQHEARGNKATFAVLNCWARAVRPTCGISPASVAPRVHAC